MAARRPPTNGNNGHMPGKVNSYFAVDDHRPVFEPYQGSYEDTAALVVDSPAVQAYHADFPAVTAAAGPSAAANVAHRPGASPPMPSVARRGVAAADLYTTDSDDSTEESVADMARDLEAVADHCDIAIPVLFSELRRAASHSSLRPSVSHVRRMGAPGSAAGAMAGSVRGLSAPAATGSSNEASPLIQNPSSSQNHKVSTESSPSHTPSARIRIGGTMVFDIDMLNEAEALSKSADRTGALTSRSLRSQASSATRTALSAAPAATATSTARHSPERDLEAPLTDGADPASGAGRRAVRFRGPSPPVPAAATDSSHESTPLSATGNINGSRRPSEGDLTQLAQANSSSRSDGTSGGKETSVKISEPTITAVDDDEDERPRVRWAEEIRRVYSYSVDNSVFITIEYARPLVGWLCLFFAVAMASFDGVIAHYYLASGVSPYASFAWAAIGQAFIALVLMVVYTLIVGGLTRTEWRFLTSAMGWTQVAVVAFMFVMMALAEQAASHMTRETRPFTGSAVHPLLIAGFGMVFKNTVFYEEIAGISVLLIGFGMAMMPADLHASRAYFAEVVYFSYGIFTASFLFACTRARARVPIPLLFASISAAFFILQLPICKLNNLSASATDPTRGVFGFANRENVLPFVFTTVFRSFSWVLYLLALRFLPPVTVSAAMVIRPIISAFSVHMAFQVTDDNGADIAAATALGTAHQTHTSFWRFLSLAHGTSAPTPLPRFGGFRQPIGPFNPVTAPPSTTTSDADLFTPLFAVGACVAVSATIYVIYISSIKRQKVELLLRLLSKRRRPRNPYSSRRPRIDAVRTFHPGSDSGSNSGDSMDGEVYPAAALRGRGTPNHDHDSDQSDDDRRATPLSPPSLEGSHRRSPGTAQGLRSPNGRMATPPVVSSGSSRTGSLTSHGVTVSGPVVMGRSPNRRSNVPVLSTSPKYMPTPPSNLTLPTQANSSSDVAVGNSNGTARGGRDEYYDDEF